MKRLYLASHLIIAFALFTLAGSALYLFGLPLSYLFTLIIGILLGVSGLLAYLVWFALNFCAKYPNFDPSPALVEEDAKEQQGKIEQEKETGEVIISELVNEPDLTSSVVGQLLPLPDKFDEINNNECEYIVWRDIGEFSFLTELNSKEGSACFSNQAEEALRFNSVVQAAKAANACYLLYQCRYKFYFSLANPVEKRIEENVRAN